MTEYGDQFNAAVAAELRAERARVGISYDALVETTGIAKSSVQRYLGGKRDIPVPALLDLCRGLGVSPRVIFDRAYDSLQDNTGVES